MLNWLWIGDAARAVGRAVDSGPLPALAYNVSGDIRPMRDAVRIVHELIPDAQITVSGGTLGLKLPDGCQCGETGPRFPVRDEPGDPAAATDRADEDRPQWRRPDLARQPPIRLLVYVPRSLRRDRTGFELGRGLGECALSPERQVQRHVPLRPHAPPTFAALTPTLDECSLFRNTCSTDRDSPIGQGDSGKQRRGELGDGGV